MDVSNVFHTAESLKKVLSDHRTQRTIGFVPTMGALHDGHLALVSRALAETEVVVVSIFVNPTQFNNPDDLAKYPRTLEEDLDKLRMTGNVLVFAPERDEIYPSDDHYSPIDLEGLEDVLEGEFRPGHFQGVVHVVRNLFRIVEPHKAYFGLKDFQQVAVIRLMVRKLQIPVEIVACPTLREPSGLALSSRNMRLTADQKHESLIIFKTLEFVKANARHYEPAVLRQKAIEYFETGKLDLEYLELVNTETLKPIVDPKEPLTCCIAAYCGDVRLIDNIQV